MIDVTVVIVWSLHYNYPYIGGCMYKLNIKSHVSKEWFNFQATIKFKNPDRLKILVKIYMHVHKNVWRANFGIIVQ